MDSFPDRYGTWAVVAGASEGLGEAFAAALAERGMNVVMVARRGRILEAIGERLADGTRHRGALPRTRSWPTPDSPGP